MKISFFEVEEWERQVLKVLAGDHEVRFEAEPLNERLAVEHADADVISTFIYSDVSSGVLDRFHSLGLIATRSTGYDHIDMGWCHEHGVDVDNVPAYGERTIAEHVFALLLAISHRIVEGVDRTRRGDFSLSGLRGFDLHGKIMGVVGTGGIGRHTVEIARGFGMDVLATDPLPDAVLAADPRVGYVDLPTLLASADVVSLHVPGGEATRHMLGQPQFARMRRGAVLINTSRGEVVDSQALLRALADGTVAAAGLDVIEAEPALREEAELLRSVFTRGHDLETLLTDHILLRMRNVIITPHSAFYTEEAVRRILDTTRDNIEAYAAGRRLNAVA
ncbi:D-lactate dehydrogenase [Nocardiopsis mwathae]|uniref:D-lactate dehydrogenase n=1 Tax=Nocardiopsis mwathae TaxID=1472723 RepID=A0A7W9YIY6_9ACTN|nr:NAD(P)-dependent oxidoreductase [Nocardiopsis mwathae]MBB6173007.1 D-lactate dehydrogenase [Nocardiopsis mwathae]